MKLLFNLDVFKGYKAKARHSDYLKSLPAEQQIAAVAEFLQWAENAAQNDPDEQARAEAGIGIATAREFPDRKQNAAARIYTGGSDWHE